MKKKQLSKIELITAIKERIDRKQYIRSELFSLYQMEYSLLLGIFIGISGGILGNFVFNFFEKNSIYYWIFLLIVLLLFSITGFKAYKKILYLNKLYQSNDKEYEELKGMKEKAEKL